MLVGRQDARGLPEVEDKDRVERLVRLDEKDTFPLGDAIADAIRRHFF